MTPESPPHPWSVKPENGAWFICVKSYTGAQSRTHAEEMCNEIRQVQRCAAYLFEWGREKRQEEEARRNMVRRLQAEQNAPFLQLQSEMKRKAEAEGREFDAAPLKVRIPKTEYPDQWAVLVGGFPDMDTASAALKTVRGWTPPQNKEHLFDRAIIGNESGTSGAVINPYASAFVVPNPTIKRQAEKVVDPILAKLNEEEELSLLKTTKPVTLFVKSFGVPMRAVTKEGDANPLARLFGAKDANMLDATAQQARELTRALRDAKMQHPFEAYVLHVRTGSMVTVGQFDSADDPALEQTRRLLLGLTFEVRTHPQVPGTYERMFPHVYPIAIPR